ncbi:hypothetical protein TYRP_014996 [Tyrophagus putrescentiae]|nr:hypothetical protein TYRP_014996 [Tyrophagus putrescentiae]
MPRSVVKDEHYDGQWREEDDAVESHQLLVDGNAHYHVVLLNCQQQRTPSSQDNCSKPVSKDAKEEKRSTDQLAQEGSL